MIFAVRPIALALLLFPIVAWSQQPAQARGAAAPEPAGKAGLDYVALTGSVLNLTSIGPTNRSAETYAVGLVLGSYISDHFKVEIRAGAGFGEERVSHVPLGTDEDIPREEALVHLDLEVPYYVSAYMGVLYPVTDYANVYGQFGVTRLEGEASTESPEEYEKIPDKLFESSFSVSWLVGLDFELTDSVYLLFEGGSLHNDSITDINTMQYNVGFRYEY